MPSRSNVRHRPTTLEREVRRADPDWDRESRVSPEYEFANGRKFERRDADFLPYVPEEE